MRLPALFVVALLAALTPAVASAKPRPAMYQAAASDAAAADHAATAATSEAVRRARRPPPQQTMAPAPEPSSSLQPAGKPATEQWQVKITAVDPVQARPQTVVTVRYLPAVDLANQHVIVLFEGKAAEIITGRPGALEVIVPDLFAIDPGRKSGDVAQVRLGGDMASEDAWTEFRLVRSGGFQLMTWLGWLAGAVLLVLIGLGAWAGWRSRQRLKSLQSELDLARFSFERSASLARAGPSSLLPDDYGPFEHGGAGDGAPEPPEELIRAVASGNCVLCFGTGISAQAGLPTWSQFLGDFLAALESSDPSGDWSSLGRQLVHGNIQLVGDLIESRGKSDELVSAIRATYGRQASAPAWLPELFARAPFAGVLTTAFDTVAETAAAARNPEIIDPSTKTDYGRLLRENRFFVLRLNSEKPPFGPMIALTAERLYRLMDEAPDLRGFLSSLCASRTVLFVGLHPLNVDAMLAVFGARAGGPNRHFVLTPEESDSAIVRERFTSRYGVELLNFTPTPGFPETGRFLAELGRKADSLRSADGSSAPRAKIATTRIASIRLSNIGPFEEAEFKFGPGWTALLGDNGCGKSTVLRAIALALCGQDSSASRDAQSLLRKGAEAGSIALTMATDPPSAFQTQISRMREGVAVRALEYGPLQSGAMVAFGFPALRGAMSSGVAAFEAAPYPRVQDVTPLIRGGVDGRAGNLKAWIKETYARSEDSRNKDRARYAAMLLKLFDLIDDLVPGFDIAFSRFDLEKGEVLLATPDGELPMDYVSQGMSSTIGWLGVLVQRLYEIYPRSPAPEQEHALLLVDEIDSHLHPEWQRVLASNIKQHFPNVQVIATTHSPLVVANMEAGEVVRITRDGGELSIETLDQSFQGYRADQVLTADAFGLSSTRGVGWELTRSEYTSLLSKKDKSSEDLAKLETLGATLEETSWPQETEEERVAVQAVKDVLADRVKELNWSPARSQKAMDEAARYMAQVSGKPSS